MPQVVYSGIMNYRAPTTPRGDGGILDIGADKKEEDHERTTSHLSTVLVIVCIVFVGTCGLIVKGAMGEQEKQEQFNPNKVGANVGVEKAKPPAHLHDYVFEQQEIQYKKDGHIDLSCLSPGFMHKIGHMKIGEKITIRCPKGCQHHKWIQRHQPLVWGTSVYSDNTMICLSGLHSTGQDGGQFEVELLAGKSAYKGSMQNGVLSADYDAHERSYSISHKS